MKQFLACLLGWMEDIRKQISDRNSREFYSRQASSHWQIANSQQPGATNALQGQIQQNQLSPYAPLTSRLQKEIS